MLRRGRLTIRMPTPYSAGVENRKLSEELRGWPMGSRGLEYSESGKWCRDRLASALPREGRATRIAAVGLPSTQWSARKGRLFGLTSGSRPAHVDGGGGLG